MSLTQGARLGPYEILSPVGSGGMGEVYRARDTRLGRIVAIKVLPSPTLAASDGRLRLAREAEAVAALSHSHICRLYDFTSNDAIDYLVMEYVEGETLGERLIGGPLPIAEVIRYAVDIADALEHAHRRGFIHRDLKPANVMVTKSGAVLLDFGLARPVFVDAAAPVSAVDTQDLTLAGSLKGTLPYMAPEQLEGREADTRTDIFAFGAVLYEMTTGRQPFAAGGHAAVIAAILASDPAPMDCAREPVPPSLERVVRKCLAKDPDERWQNAHDLKTALQWVSHAVEPSDSVPTRWLAGAGRRERLAWSVAGVSLLVAIAAMGWSRIADRSRTRGDPAPVTFSVAAPEKAALFPGGGVMAVSPDGRHLAFIATPAGGKPLVWIRPLISAAARPLLRTAGASQPFWSPDSKFVGFFADGKLKTAAIASGEVQTLCDARGTAGTWSQSGVILFKPEASSSIERVPADGGAPMVAVGPDSSRGERYILWPHFLPDGRHFLYMVIATEPDVTGIYAASVDGRERRRVLGDESQAFYVWPGYLLFRRETTVYAQRFDLTSLRVWGDAIPLVDNVGFNFATRRGIFSASNTGVLAYKTTEDSELGWFDRRGNPLGTIEPAGKYSDPAISPDGRTIAVARLDRQLGTDDIWLIDVRSGVGTQFTFDPGRDRAPVWSPGGDRIAFAARRGPMEEIFVKSSTSGSSEELLFSPGRAVHPVNWSRGRDLLLFVLADEQRHFDLWTLLIPEHRAFPVQEQPASENIGELSPDGRWLAYDSNEGGEYAVYVRPFPGPSDQRRRISERGGIEPKWRKDGTELFYLGADQRLMAATVRTGSNFDHDPPRALFETGTVGQHLGMVGRNQYDVAPDGERFLVNRPGRQSSTPITVVLNWPALLSR